MTEHKLACYTAPWGQNGLIKAITDISEYGFNAIECPAITVQMYEDRLHIFEEILESSGLELAGLLQGVNLLDWEHADEQVEHAANSARFVSAAGSRTLTICHSKLQSGPLSDEEWATLAAILEEIGERCGEFQTQVCFLPRAQRLVGTEREIKRLLAMTNPKLVKLAVDTAEIGLAGGSPQRVVKNHLERIRAVRLRDVSASRRRAKATSNKPGTTPQFGRGNINFDAVTKVLLNGGYDGFITMDVSGESRPPAQAIASGYRFLTRRTALFEP